MKFYFLLILNVHFNIIFSMNQEYIDSSRVKDPKLALKLGLIPGMGQLYNGKEIKSIFFISSQCYALKKCYLYNRSNEIGKRNTYAWWSFGLFIWNILDSYVDSHLTTFPIKKIESSTYNDSLIIDL